MPVIFIPMTDSKDPLAAFCGYTTEMEIIIASAVYCKLLLEMT